MVFMQEWNTKLGYTDDLINERKMLLFITEMSTRPPKQRGVKKRRVNETQAALQATTEATGADAEMLGFKSIDGYACAVMDLWVKQYSVTFINAGQSFPIRFSPSPKTPWSQGVLEELQNPKRCKGE